MPLDMFGQAQSDTNAYVQRNNAPRLPATFGDTFDAAFNENRLFGQSIAGENSRAAALGDYMDEVTRKTGEQFADLPFELGATSLLLPHVNDKVAKLKAANPDLAIDDLTPEGLDQRAIAKSKAARADFQEMQAREKTLGGSLGSLTGAAAGSLTDPVNLVVAPLAAPEGLGLLATALAWSAIGGGSQAAIEAIGSPYRETVSPGYGASGEPARNVLGAAAFGGAAGGFFKGLGMAWGRAKTGVWPRSIRDAGNVVESEAQVAQSNVLPGIEGEVAHRDALAKTIDDVVAGRKVEVPEEITAPHEAKLDVLMAERAHWNEVLAESKARLEEPAPELPLEPTTPEVHEATIADGVQNIARMAGHDMPREEAEKVAKMVAGASDDERARAILSAVFDRPQTVADFPPSPLPKAREGELAGSLEPKTIDKAVASPEFEQALRADIDRARATGDVKIPAGIDEKGQPVFRSVDAAMNEIDALKAAADQIKACANPQPEPAEAA